MCGIFGFATAEKSFDTQQRKEIFLNGMLFNMPRGMDGTGAAGFWTETTAGKKEIVSRTSKRGIHFLDWYNSKSADLFLDKFADYNYVIGHVRATTKGSTSDKNSHPFEYGDITLVHNGTINNRIDLDKADEWVDSADICATMAKRGEADTLPMLDGGFALVWHNAKDDTINFARNGRKPLAFAFTKKRNEMYYCSEWPVLWAVLMRNKIKMEIPVCITKPYHHYKFSLADLRDYKDVEFAPFSRNPQSSVPKSKGMVRTQQSPPVITDIPTGTTSPLPKENNSSKSTEENSTNDRAEYSNRILKDYGLQINQLLIMRPTGWSAYKNSKNETGQLHGFKYPDGSLPPLGITIPHVALAQWQQISAKNLLVGCLITNVKGLTDHTMWCELDWSWTMQLAKAKGLSKSSEIGGFDSDIRRYYVVKEGIRRLLTPKEAADFMGISLDEVERHMRLPVLHRTYYGPQGRTISKDEWDRLTTDGCGECTADIDLVSGPTDGRQLVWIENSPLCLACSMRHSQAEKMGLRDKVH